MNDLEKLKLIIREKTKEILKLELDGTGIQNPQRQIGFIEGAGAALVWVLKEINKLLDQSA